MTLLVGVVLPHFQRDAHENNQSWKTTSQMRLSGKQLNAASYQKTIESSRFEVCL